MLILVVVSEYNRDKLLKDLKQQRDNSLELQNNLQNELKLTQMMMNDFLLNYNKLIEKSVK